MRVLFTTIGVCVAVGGAFVAWLSAGRREDSKRRPSTEDTPTPQGLAPDRPAATARRPRPAASATPAAPKPKAVAHDSAVSVGTSYGPNGSSQEAESEARASAEPPKATAARPHTPSPTDSAPIAVFHLVPGDTGWQLKSEGDETPIGRFPTKKAGLDAARRLAREREPSRLVVHRVDGSIQNQFSYGDR